MNLSLCSRLMRFGFAAVLAGSLQGNAAYPLPLERAHAHNDYEHPRPLLDALAQGFCSVEADIFLVEGRLLVAHETSQTKPERTLETLYLDPLQERVRQHGGRVYPGGPGFTLLIDLKTDGEVTYAALKPVLERYASILTEFTPTDIRTNAVTVILSGNRPLAVLAAESRRLAALDGRLTDLQSNLAVSLMPLVSDNGSAQFAWRGNGPLPSDQAERLRALVQTAHAQGRRIRFWGLPDQPAAWQALWDAGVDLINTDRLAELATFLRSR